jgi:outer membrane protein
MAQVATLGKFTKPHWSTALRILDRFFLVACLSTLSWFSAAQAADYKIGVVNVARILEASPQADEARKKLQKEFAARDAKLVSQQKELKTLEDRMQKDGAIMSETERGRVERDVMAKTRDIKRETQEFQEDVNFRRNEEMAIINQKIGEAINALAKEQGFDLVLGQGLAFASEKVDITEQVIAKLKGGAAK